MRPLAKNGFTLTELVIVITILGTLSVVAIPKLTDSGVVAEAGFRNQVVAALRAAQKMAVSHRRAVCAVIAGNQVSLTIAPDAIEDNPAVTCSKTVNGIDGTSVFAKNSRGITVTAASIVFQPSGVATSSIGSSLPVDSMLTVGSLPSVNVYGATGYVD